MLSEETFPRTTDEGTLGVRADHVRPAVVREPELHEVLDVLLGRVVAKILRRIWPVLHGLVDANNGKLASHVQETCSSGSCQRQRVLPDEVVQLHRLAWHVGFPGDHLAGRWPFERIASFTPIELGHGNKMWMSFASAKSLCKGLCSNVSEVTVKMCDEGLQLLKLRLWQVPEGLGKLPNHGLASLAFPGAGGISAGRRGSLGELLEDVSSQGSRVVAGDVSKEDLRQCPT